jgi:hypothetical protein
MQISLRVAKLRTLNEQNWTLLIPPTLCTLHEEVEKFYWFNGYSKLALFNSRALISGVIVKTVRTAYRVLVARDINTFSEYMPSWTQRQFMRLYFVSKQFLILITYLLMICMQLETIHSWTTALTWYTFRCRSMTHSENLFSKSTNCHKGIG